MMSVEKKLYAYNIMLYWYLVRDEDRATSRYKYIVVGIYILKYL